MIKCLLLSRRKDRRKERKRERKRESTVIVVEEQRGRRFKLDIKNRFLL
jgi:hypothetical protein